MPLQSNQLLIRLRQACRLTIGRLGTYDFPAGNDVYTGSDRRNIGARIRHHLSQKKTLRWHIDYLLASPSAEITCIEQSITPERTLNQSRYGKVIVPRFGASDCGNNCFSHLKYRGACQRFGEVIKDRC